MSHSDCMEGDGHKYVPAEAYDALLKERDALKAKLQVAVEALKQIEESCDFVINDSENEDEPSLCAFAVGDNVKEVLQKIKG